MVYRQTEKRGIASVTITKEDLYELEYENYHNHSHLSNILSGTPDSVTKPSQIAERAKELGQQCLFTTEHGWGGDIFVYHEEAIKNGLKPIFASELYFVKDRHAKDRANSHIMLIAKNENGKKELNRIITEANKTGFYGKARIDEELLFSLTSDNFLVTSACVGSFLNKYGDEYAKEILPRLKEHFGDNFYLEVQYHNEDMQKTWNKKVLEYSDTYDIPIIFGADSHYIDQSDMKWRDIFVQSKGIIYEDETEFILDYPDVKTIVDRFIKQGVLTNEQIKESIDNTLVTRTFEGYSVDKKIKMPNYLNDLTHEGKDNKLKQILNKEWVKYRRTVPRERWGEYIKAIQEETKVVIDTKMSEYFLLNHEIVKLAISKYNGVITTTARGSGASFFINTLLGFSTIDRLDENIQLYPSRFMSKTRILLTKSLPDIDMNVADREPFVQASKEVLGDEYAVDMLSYTYLKEKEAFRVYCRYLELDIDEYNEVGKNIDEYRDDEKWGSIIEESSNLVGVISAVSKHPCSILLSPINIVDDLGVFKAGEYYVCPITSDESDDYKYLKNDFLFVDTVNDSAKIYEEIGIPQHTTKELKEITKDDQATWDIYANGLTSKVNQLSEENGRQLAMRYKPQNIDEVSALVAVMRPGQASIRDDFINRKDHTYGSDSIDALFGDTNGYILYQEQIMKLLKFSGFAEEETYQIIKDISKKKVEHIMEIKPLFIDGLSANLQKCDNFDEQQAIQKANDMWVVMEDASAYSFNASHSLAYAYDSVYGAYLKANYPLQSYTVYLEANQSNSDVTSNLTSELPYFGIDLSTPVFGNSESSYSYDTKTNTIYKGMSSIKYMNDTVAPTLNEIYNEKKWDVNNFSELVCRIFESSVDSRQFGILIQLGYFEDFGPQHLLLNIMDVANNKQSPYKKAFDLCVNSRIETLHESDEYRNATDKQKETMDKRALKFPLKYDKNHKENTKKERMANLYEYETQLRNINQNKKTDLYKKLQAEKEYLGYYSTVVPNLENDIYILLESNLKYTPLLTIYNLKRGTIDVVKVIKEKFYIKNIPILKNGDIFRINRTHKENAKKLIDGKWVDNPQKQWVFLDKISKVKELR